jgi:chemotaxis protein CheZ
MMPMISATFAERRASHAAQLAAMGAALDSGDEAAFNAAARELAEECESDAMRELRRVTHDLQEALDRFRVDSRLDDLAQKEVPDARQRLEHVMRLTDDAAHTTLDLIEQSCPLADRTATRAAELLSAWNGPDRPSRKQVRSFLDDTTGNLGQVRAKLSQVLLAQGYQDLTGQIIRGVMKLVDELEVALRLLVNLSGGQAPSSARDASADAARGFGPVVPGVHHGATVNGQTDVDALLSDLGM